MTSPLSPPSRTDRRKRKTHDLVVATAMRLFHEHGFDTVTMEQIAEAADIAKGTLYAYFHVKEAIVAAYLDQESIARNAERVVRMRALRSTRARLTASLTELAGAIRVQPEMFERYFTYRMKQMVSLRRDAQAAPGLRLLEDEIIRMGQAAGELRTDLPLPLLEALYEFCFIIVAQRYFESPEEFDAKVTIRQCVDVFMNGAGAEAF